MKKIVMISSLILASVCALYGGDTARFVNLGFSADGAYFMFGEHGYQADKGRVYSDLYIVDVVRNVFTPGGVVKGEFESVVEPGQSSDGALFSILDDTVEQRHRYGISFLDKGRPLYIRIPESENDDKSNSLEFRDFQRDMKYTVVLNQTAEGEGDALQSRFYIDLKIEYKNGIVKKFQVGHPNYNRKGISEYSINRILLSPKEDSLIFIITKTDRDLNVRYMIETVKIR